MHLFLYSVSVTVWQSYQPGYVQAIKLAVSAANWLSLYKHWGQPGSWMCTMQHWSDILPSKHALPCPACHVNSTYRLHMLGMSSSNSSSGSGDGGGFVHETFLQQLDTFAHSCSNV
jgi:hypothetical protein